jgi:hypothetical protein
MPAPSVLPGRSFQRTDRVSRLLFHDRASDLSLVPLTGQVPTLVRATPHGYLVGRDGRLHRPVHSQPGFQCYDLDGDGVFERPGLYIGRQRTNLLLRSEELDHAAWTKVAAAATADVVVAPNALKTADQLKEDGTSNAHYAHQSVTIVAGEYVIASAHAKLNVGTRGFRIRVDSDTAVNGFRANFNLALGTIPYTDAIGTGTFAYAAVEPLVDGWVRCLAVGKVAAAATAVRAAYMLLATAADVNEVYTGDNASAHSLWGMQVESTPGPAIPGVYIPTTTAVGTKNQDALAYASNLTPRRYMTLYASLPRAKWMDYTGSLGTEVPGVLQLGESFPAIALFFNKESATPRTVASQIADAVGGDVRANANLGSGPLIELCAQFEDLTQPIGGRTRCDAGAGFTAWSSRGAMIDSFPAGLPGGQGLEHGLFEIKVAGSDTPGAGLYDTLQMRGLL